jgi:hypothetical protein
MVSQSSAVTDGIHITSLLYTSQIYVSVIQKPICRSQQCLNLFAGTNRTHTETETVLLKQAIATDRNSDSVFAENNKYFVTIIINLAAIKGVNML